MTKGNSITGTIVTAQDLRKYLKLSKNTIYKLALEGKLPGFKIGDSWRFDMEEILKLFQGSNKRSKEHTGAEIREGV